MTDQTKGPKFAQTVVEQNSAEYRDLATAQPVPRKATPIGMPAPPHKPQQEDRQSYDDIEHVQLVERLERDRAELLAKLQDRDAEVHDLKSENRTLREVAPTAFFPPPSLPPPEDKKASVELDPGDDKEAEKSVLSARLRQLATGVGIFAAMAMSAFSSYRAQPEKAEAAQARVAAVEQASNKDTEQRVREQLRTLQAMRAEYCYFKQIRGALQKQGIDLPSLPGGGVTLRRLDQGDPSKAPAFVAAETCDKYPDLPPEVTTP